MFSLILLCFNISLFLYILVYGFLFLTLPFIRPLNRGTPSEAASDQGSVTVLIPSHNEGESLTRTIDSVIQQNYSGQIKIVALIKDRSDTSFSHLISHFTVNWGAKQSSGVIFRSENREVSIECSGVAPKKDKLNKYLSKISTAYIGFLDADHRAKADWISSSIKRLENSNLAGIQSRRQPLSLRKIPQLWDSAQNHIGNELVNITLNRAVGTVFFTGTTCVFKTPDLVGRKFGDCVTEDTYLSYELLRDGRKIGYNPESGSNEEVAPDFHSYLARRRRWSCGHNKTFFTLIPGILRADIDLRTKASILVHGLFYTVPVAVCLLLNIYGLHMFVQYTTRIQLLIVLLTFLVSSVVTLFMFGRHRSVLREIFVLALWLLPQAILITPWVLFLMEHELFFFLTMFPYQRKLIWFHSFCLLAPIFLLFAGSLRIKVLRLGQLLLVLVTYPALFFLDLWACLLGFSDFLLGRPTWAKIQRTHEEDVLLTAEGAGSKWMSFRWAALIAAVLFLVVSFNDLTADSNCGDPVAYLFDPQIFTPKTDLAWKVEREVTKVGADDISITFKNTFSSALPEDARIDHYLDDKLIKETRGNTKNANNFEFEMPLGWTSHEYQPVLRTGGMLCRRKRYFTSTLKELVSNKLFVNGEEFLVKGVIPSFSPAREEPGVEKGLAQIKELGANTVRYYHKVRKDIRKKIETLQLMLIEQPDGSTWSDTKPSNPLGRLKLENRFGDLLAASRGSPYSLFPTLGNELEILDPNTQVPYLIELMENIKQNFPDDPFAYSTFYVYLRLPVSVLGLNMLDSGETYWSKGMDTVKALNIPFYASEFGGFVAHTEWTPPELRALRLSNYSARVMAAGAMGTVIHESHDNLAQPVVEGFNDPLSIDMPDDLRGIWDERNHEKFIKRFIEQLYSDFDFRLQPGAISPEQSEVQISFTNRRNYLLKDVKFFEGENFKAGPFDFAPHATLDVQIPLAGSGDDLVLRTIYSTHRGLSAVSTIRIPLPKQTSHPLVLNNDAIEVGYSDGTTTGKLLKTNTLRASIPQDWRGALINGEKYEAVEGIVQAPLRSSVEEVINLEGSRDAKEWSPISPVDVGGGPRRVRFKLKRKYPEGSLLLLAGLGTDEFWIRYGEAEWVKTKGHRYRENIVKLDDFDYSPDDFFYLLLPRDKTVFIESKDHPLGKEVDIDFEIPHVFSPSPFSIQRSPN